MKSIIPRWHYDAGGEGGSAVRKTSAANGRPWSSTRATGRLSPLTFPPTQTLKEFHHTRCRSRRAFGLPLRRHYRFYVGLRAGPPSPPPFRFPCCHQYSAAVGRSTISRKQHRTNHRTPSRRVLAAGVMFHHSCADFSWLRIGVTFGASSR